MIRDHTYTITNIESFAGAVKMSENILMWQIAHFCVSSCEILTISMRYHHILLSHKPFNAKIAHSEWKLCAILQSNVLNHASLVPNPIIAGVNPGFCRVESGETFYFNMFRCHHSKAQWTTFSEFSLGVHPGFMLSSWWSLLRYNKRLVSYNI